MSSFNAGVTFMKMGTCSKPVQNGAFFPPRNVINIPDSMVVKNPSVSNKKTLI